MSPSTTKGAERSSQAAPGPPPLPQSLMTPAGCPPGAEPLAHLGGVEGVLVLHGFTGTPWEVRPVAEACVAQGYSVAMPVLAGHATSVRALNETEWRDWLASARAALDWLDAHCERVHVVGLSMGALLALLLAQQQPRARTGAVVLLAPALAFERWHRVSIHLLGRLGWPETIGRESKDLAGGQRSPGYRALPLRATRQLLELLDLVRGCIAPPAGPVLVLHGDRDLTIPHRLALRRARELLGPAADLRVIRGGAHLLPRGVGAAQVIDAAIAFLARLRP